MLVPVLFAKEEDGMTAKTTLRHDIPVRIWKVINILMMTLAFAVVWYTVYSVQSRVHYYRRGSYLVLFLYAVLYFSYSRAYDGFHISISKVWEIVYSQFLALLFTNVIFFLFIWLITLHLPTLWPMILCLLGQIFLSVVWTFVCHRWYFATYQPGKTMVIYDRRDDLENLVEEYELSGKFQVVKNLHVTEVLDHLSMLAGMETVFLAGVSSHHRNIILKYCIQYNIGVYVIPRVGDVLMASATRVHLFHLPMLHVKRYRPVPEYLAIKRLFDIIVSLLAIILLSPLMFVVAMAVKSDGGPIIYKQVRLTKDGKRFNIYKFRSMKVDAEKDGVARLSTGDKDDRITKVGRIIRALRFDELPQLFNILSGDMSIVGPRPERPEIAKQYEEEIPEFRLRLQAKAGLTGYAQVYGKYNTTAYDKLLMDLMYIGNPSLVEDLKICFATVKILFMPESTEGVAAGQTTAMDYENAADSTENDAETVEK